MASLDQSRESAERPDPDGGEASWRRYITRLRLQDPWDDSREQTEAERYGPVLAHLAEAEKRKERAEDRLLDEKEFWCTKLRRQRDRLAPYMDRINEVCAAADKVLESRADRTTLEARHAKAMRACEDRLPRALPHETIWLGDWDDEDSRQLKVVNSLARTAYYLGHEGGTFIFRYLARADPNALQDEAAEDTPSWDPLGSLSILESDPGRLADDFTYCGQVPRPLEEYFCRLTMLLPDVFKMVASLIGFHLGPDESRATKLRELCERSDPAPGLEAADQVMLFASWVETFPEEKSVPDHGRCRLRRSGKVLELVRVFAKIGAARVLRWHKFLIHTLEMATGCSFRQLIELNDMRLAQEAFAKLLVKREVDEVFVFKDSLTMDVHDFYRQDLFRFDPSHHSRRYQRPDVSEAPRQRA
ncbi:hypothetical protein CDD83_1470 [Cordyceps sp. RAO-2017]|nr:hypothetical protein CDD83_1470 [Cordyceps sp. RAO-2017]